MKILETLKSSLPSYSTIQPSTRKKIKFRPFTVKEEKVLLTANETGNFDDFLITLTNVIDECYGIKKSIHIPIFDIEYFFIKLRSKSIGELVNPTFKCPETDESITVNLNLDEVEPVYDETHNKTIKISDTILVTMKYPSVDYIINNKGDYYDMIIDCIEKIETKEELIESDHTSRQTIQQFVDLLTKPQFSKLTNFFKTMPKIEHEVKYQTSDGVTRKIKFKGIRDFFQ